LELADAPAHFVVFEFRPRDFLACAHVSQPAADRH
jgi:hypothetical protein